jgi:hypothetical protein
MSFWAQSQDLAQRLPVSFASTTAFSVAEDDEARGSALPEFATEAEAEAFTGSQYSRTDVLRTSFR